MSDRLRTVENAVAALDRRELGLDNRLEAVEGKVRADQLETARERGLPADLVAAETNVWRRLSPARNRWPEIAAFDERAAELEIRQAEVAEELRQLHEQARTAPDVDAAALAEWELGDREGPRPVPTLPAIEQRIKEGQDNWDALTVAVCRVLEDKTGFVEKHRGRLVKDGDSYADEAHRRCLDLIDQLEAARDDLRQARRASVWARLFPSHKAGPEPVDALAGGRKRALVPLGVNAPVSPGHVLAALRADADWLREAATPEQILAIEGRDPRQPPNTQWHDDPETKAERAKRMAAWANSR